MVFKKILKGALHVSTGGTTYLAEKGYKAIKKKTRECKYREISEKKTKSIRIKEKIILDIMRILFFFFSVTF